MSDKYKPLGDMSDFGKELRQVKPKGARPEPPPPPTTEKWKGQQLKTALQSAAKGHEGEGAKAFALALTMAPDEVAAVLEEKS